MKIALEKAKDHRYGIHWSSCSPFVENSMAVLVHRPRYVVTHKIGARWKSHIAVSCWCGSSFTGTKKFTFLDVPKAEALLCARCEKKGDAGRVAISLRADRSSRSILGE